MPENPQRPPEATPDSFDAPTQYEYAVFTVEFKINPLEITHPFRFDWPNVLLQTQVLAELNRIGAEGWEVFERKTPQAIHSRMIEEGIIPYNFWARRVKR